MSTMYYTEDHEYIRVEDDIGTVGITEHAQSQLGDVVFVELPEPGTKVVKGDEAGTVESVKAASEIYAPVSGEIVEVNEALGDEPGTVNSDPLGEGWFYKIRLAAEGELEHLMDEDAYKAFAAED